MPITDTFVLPNDVLLIPASDLPPQVREKITCKDGDVAITRPHIRAPSKIVGAAAAALLRQFEQPKTIVAAVLDYSQQTADDPDRVLEQALPFLRNLIDSHVLLEAGSAGAERITATLAAGDRFAGFEVVGAVHVVEDTEVYQARRGPGDAFVALKIVRLRDGVDLSDAFARENAVLAHLDGDLAPRLIDSGVSDGRPFLALEWIYGAPVPVVAADLHQSLAGAASERDKADARVRLHDLAVRVADAYARLHERGVLHSDVHADNLLVDDAGRIKIIDFGYARFVDDFHPLSRAPRAGVGFYYEPEYARAILAGRRDIPSSAQGEQYSVAAIIYQVLTGAPHLDFSLNYEEMLRQIVESDARPWSAHNIAPWPELEQIVCTALSRDPARRFASIRALADALRKVAPGAAAQNGPQAAAVAPSSNPVLSTTIPAPHATFINRVLQRIQPGGDLFRSGIGKDTRLPTPSANHGAAGIAYAALRLAERRGDPQLLALADLWITKVLAEAATESSFYNDALDITEESVSRISFHHMPPGVHYVRALISGAMADAPNELMAISSFVEYAQHDADNLDLTLGRASVLHGCSLLLDEIRDSPYVDPTQLVRLGDTIVGAIWRRVDTFAPVPASGELTYLGMAHGWAGLLYSTLRWCEMKASVGGGDARSLVPPALQERLRELASCGTPAGRGMIWPWFNTPPQQAGAAVPSFMPGWCNGNAGHVFLWTEAHRVFGDPAHLDLARRAAWGMVEQPTPFNNLCCGATGCAYAALSLYRHTGDRDWLSYARRYADRVATGPDQPPQHPTDVDSLYKGEIGMMMLLDDLADPDHARMPLFE